ncbi:MAG: hypothetical protein HN849_22610 [Victivallales bacterium]|jgi:glycerophosphoryl diester phosphodiesterase|nr:hypothetical protein [Victivallales bacterium]
MRRDILVVAHRGFSGTHPENTLFAFRKALDIHADVIEFDVHLTRDGHPVSEVDPKSRTNGTRY